MSDPRHDEITAPATAAEAAPAEASAPRAPLKLHKETVMAIRTGLRVGIIRNSATNCWDAKCCTARISSYTC